MYDDFLASIHAIGSGYYGNNEIVIEAKIEKLMDKLDAAFMRHEISEAEYDELTFELSLV